MRRLLVSLATLVALVLLGALPAVADTFDPYDFEVDIRGGPQITPPQPSCTEDAGAITCSTSFDFAMSGQRLTGTVRSRSKGLSGSIETVCDMSQRMRQRFRFSPGGGMEVLEFSGSGSQSCSWFMDFGSSTLAGSISGRMEMGLASPSSAYFGGTFSVVVVAGTGAFEGMVGTGVFNQHEEFPLPTGGVGARQADTGAGSSAGAGRSLAALAGGNGSRMKLKLRRGRPLARIVSPGPRLKRVSDAKLRVVSAPGSSCRASARNGELVVDLGRASDGDRDGLVVFSGRVASKLKPGAWTVTASCVYQLGKLRGIATARAPVLLA